MVKKILYIMFFFISTLTSANATATIETNKDIYQPTEQIIVNFNNALGDDQDWIGIYPSGSTNDWGNVIKWKWAGGQVSGTKNFESLPVGTYDVRLFFQNSFNLEASKQIVVEDNNSSDNNDSNTTTVTTTKTSYLPDEEIVVNFDNMSGANDDWIGIYPVGSTNDWENVIKWKWAGGQVSGTKSFESLPVGTYDIRLFFQNSFNLEATKQIVVEDNNDSNITTVTTTKTSYLPDEEIVANFDNMSGANDDWIGIYPKGSSNDWGNVVAWKWIHGDTLGTKTFAPLPIGEYDIRVFFNNSFNLEANSTFVIEIPVSEELNISLEKDNYEPFELLHVNFANMRGQATDWIGIFPVGADNEKNSSIEWRDTNSTVTGQLSFNGVEAGDYELRAYFGTELKETVPFTIVPTESVRVLYDDFESGTIDPRWVRVSGKDMTLLNIGAIDLAVGHKERQVWTTGQHSLRTYADYHGGGNYAGYYYDFENPDKKLKFLEVDMKIGVSSHVFAFGVKANTKFGERRIQFAAWLNHTLPSGQQIIRGPYGNVLPGHRGPFVTANGYLQTHPAPSDFYVGTSSNGGGNSAHMFVHYKINIEKELRKLEPDNELLGIALFIVSGGDYDNLALSSQ